MDNKHNIIEGVYNLDNFEDIGFKIVEEGVKLFLNGSKVGIEGRYDPENIIGEVESATLEAGKIRARIKLYNGVEKARAVLECLDKGLPIFIEVVGVIEAREGKLVTKSSFRRVSLSRDGDPDSECRLIK